MPDGDYAGIVKKMRPEGARPGKIVPCHPDRLASQGPYRGNDLQQAGGCEGPPRVLGTIAEPLWRVSQG